MRNTHRTAAAVEGAAALVLGATLPAQVAVCLPDLVVTDLTWSPSPIWPGTEVTFTATVKNVGRAATPAGVPHRVRFEVDNGFTRIWSESSTAPLGPGQSRTLTGDTGQFGGDPVWRAVPQRRTVTAAVDETGLVRERNERNNHREVPGTTPCPAGTSGGHYAWHATLLESFRHTSDESETPTGSDSTPIDIRLLL